MRQESGAYRRIINDLWQRRVNDKNDTLKNDVGMSDVNNNEGVTRVAIEMIPAYNQQFFA